MQNLFPLLYFHLLILLLLSSCQQVSFGAKSKFATNSKLNLPRAGGQTLRSEPIKFLHVATIPRQAIFVRGNFMPLPRLLPSTNRPWWPIVFIATKNENNPPTPTPTQCSLDQLSAAPKAPEIKAFALNVVDSSC